MARIVFIAVLAVLAVLGSVAISDAAVIAGGQNPFDQVVPDFQVFGAAFNDAWKKALAGVWGLGFVWLGFSAIRATLEFVRARKGGYGAQVAENKEELINALIAVGVMSALGVIFGGIVAMF